MTKLADDWLPAPRILHPWPDQRFVRRRNGKFESTSLQQTVRLSLNFSLVYRKAGSCRGVRGPGQAPRLAETRKARQHHANCR
jgi:hypothetical protein